MKKFNLLNATLSFLPFLLFLIFYIAVFKYTNHIFMVSTLFLTFVIGLALIKKDNITKKMGLLSLIILLLVFSIMGHFDYIRWTSTLIALIIGSYYSIIYILYKK